MTRRSRLSSAQARAWALCAAVLLLAVFAGCAEDGATTGPGADAKPSTGGGEEGARRARQDRPQGRAQRIEPARCPAGVPDCRSATGRIVYVERVDPDGDGDAHFVIADPQGITLRGYTAIDVRRELRPRPLPGVGELISAAGPVQTGSYGQSQIHALELRVAVP